MSTEHYEAHRVESDEERRRKIELMLARLQSFHRTVDIEFWRQRLRRAEDAIIHEFQYARTGRPEVRESNCRPTANNPVPIREELLLWRSCIESAFKATCRLNQMLADDPEWAWKWPEILAYSRNIRERAFSVLGYVDQLLLELEIEAHFRRFREWEASLTPIERYNRAKGQYEWRAYAREQGHDVDDTADDTPKPSRGLPDTPEYSEVIPESQAQGKDHDDARRRIGRKGLLGNGSLIH